MNYKKLLCLLLCLCITFSAVLNSAAVTEEELQQDVDNIQQQINDQQTILDGLTQDAEALKTELDKIEGELSTLEGEVSGLQAQVHQTNEQIISLTNEYNQLTKEIEEKNKSIIRTTATIKETEKTIEKSKTSLAAKLRSAYMNGNESTFKILMGADNLASFLTRLELMKRTSENDKKAISDFEKQVTTLNKAKVKLEQDKATIEQNQKKVADTKAQYVVKKNELQVKEQEYQDKIAVVEGKYAEVEAIIAAIDKESSAYLSYIQELELQKAEASAALDQFIQSHIANNPPLSTENNEGESSGDVYYESNDTWVWPVGDHNYYISAYFLDPTYYAEFGTNHYGVDITGGGFYGAAIYAARAGTVISSGDAGDGYGCKVIIDHGDGFITVYAHNSYNVVSTGQYVGKGELIGYGGSTGYSTGPHLHYEVRYNGEKVNPANYHPGKI